MNKDKLGKWAELLLDTGKRNNLINFKDTKLSSLDVLSPNVATLFTRAEHSAVFEVYDPKLNEDEEEPSALESEQVRATKSEEKLNKAEYLKAYERKLKKHQILVFNEENKPISALKNISKKAKTAVEETGVNIAYFAFGFIEWTETESSQAVLRAPILLAPISIQNESSIEPYSIKVLDDEMIVNPTFAFKLQHEYGIKLPEFDEEEGIEEYFTKLDGLLSKLKWRVVSECKIGIFSFLKINIYKDLKDNAEKIVQNVSVRALLGDFEKGKTEENGAPAVGDLLDLHNVVDADSSQAEAIEMAVQGKSFVLQGPPGTGKSQTITNMIAECLLHGKKVLFVSEKLAALNVVYEKLKNVGLEEFCLELHSHKANKKQVIEELCHTLKLPKSGVSEQAAKELKEKKESQHILDAYAVELHKVRPVIGKSLYALYEEISACRFAPDLEFVVANLPAKGGAYAEQAETALSRYVAYLPSIGYDYRKNVWYGYKKGDCSYQAVVQVKADLLAVAELCKAIEGVSKKMQEKYGARVGSLTQAHAFEKFFALVKDSGFITPALLHAPTLQKTAETVKKLQGFAKEILKKKSALEATFDEDIYKLDGQTLHKKLTKQFSGVFSRLFSGEYRRIVGELKLCEKEGKKPSYKKAVGALETLSAYQRQMKEFSSLQNTVQSVLGVAYDGVNTDFERCLSELKELSSVQAKGLAFAGLATMGKQAFSAEQPTFAELFTLFQKPLDKYAEAETRLLACFDKKEYDLENVGLESLERKCTGCYENADKLDNWCQFVQLLQTLQSMELRSFVDFTIQKRVAEDKILPAYKKAFYSQWVDLVLREVPLLFGLARVPHDETVRRFREKDRIHFEINKAKIKSVLSEKRPSLDLIAQGSSIAILLREGEKKRKQKGIRSLLAEIGELAQTLKPCFLMSPLSVSTYLSADMQFDVVIFDEASQIFPQDAVGAIYRGKQLIVVGDSKQMPPSNFFNASIDVDTDEETEDITDFESILDLCSTAFPQRRLKWHYRSRFEQLISFSNKNFYENDLTTFPSSTTDKKGVGVDYIYVDGVFDRKSKTNRAEAERIVELVFEHIEKYPDRSLGVVAFSISQQNLIDKLIAKRRQKDASKDFFFKSDKIEPFFVKNLETVQGDERDTIIFSIAYAKDAQGRLLANFGPVNREGGERRLNVAVTRAKYNVQIVSSMHYSDIDLAGSKSLGARLLRDYLDYAENGATALQRTESVNPFEKNASQFEMEVCDFLREQGCNVDTKVGCSAFKIDVAVKKPDSSDYVLAIECDGQTYRSSKTARDRDRLRQDILERMGWKFYRIWSTDWFRNKRMEKERLLKAVREAFERSAKKPAKGGNTEEVSFEKTLESRRFEFPKYHAVDVVALGKRWSGDILRVVRAVVEAEAPVSEEWLLKRMVYLFDGREKVTNVVREQFEYALKDCKKYGIIRYNGFFYMQGWRVPLLRVPENGTTPRDVKYIPLEELANGIWLVLKQNVSVEKSGLFRLLSTQLGFARIGDAILERLEKALKVLGDRVERNGEMLSLKEN